MRPATPRAWSDDVDAAAALRTGIAPGAMLGARAGTTLRSARRGRVAADLDLDMAYAASGPFEGSSPNATYKLFAARVGACPVRLVRAVRFAVATCVATELGAVVGTGESATLAETTTASRFWADVALEARARWVLVGPLFATLAVGAAFSLVRPTFVFEKPFRSVDSVAA